MRRGMSSSLPPQPQLSSGLDSPVSTTVALETSLPPTTTPGVAPRRPLRASRSAASLDTNGAEGRDATSTTSSDTCPVCIRLAYKRKRDVGVVWVECDACETWYHWACVAPNALDRELHSSASPSCLSLTFPFPAVNLIDKWYCTSCTSASATSSKPFATTYKVPPRKSSRGARQLDYANLDAHLPADADRWLRVLATRQVVEGTFRHVKAEELTDEWIYGEGNWDEPFVMDEEEGLGMKMPPREMTIGEIAQAVGPKTPIEVIDVASQSSLSHWTLAQWVAYYTDPHRDKVRNVISLEVSESSLAPRVVAPEVVRKLDWVETIWPEDHKQPGMYPRVQKYCLMSVARCWTDWHIDFAGSSVFYHVLRGAKTFFFIRPTPANLAAYQQWSGSAERQETTWLGDDVDVVYKVDLTAGNTMIIPTGWIHAVYTPCDTLVFGGNFLHSLNIPTQLRVYQIELATKVPRKFRFPHFVRLLWYVANHYASILRLLPPSEPLPLGVTPSILQGLKTLSTFLIDQVSRFAKHAPVSPECRRIARENVPWETIAEPAKLARELRGLLLAALGEEADRECSTPPPYVKEEVEADSHEEKGRRSTSSSRSSPVPTPAKRKASEQVEDAPKSKFKHWTSEPAKSSKLAKRDDGEILSRTTVPVSVLLTREERVDPTAEELGARMADVKTTASTTTVVRSLMDEDEVLVVETRTVVTTVERVRWDPREETPMEVDTSVLKIHLPPRPMSNGHAPLVDTPPPATNGHSSFPVSFPFTPLPHSLPLNSATTLNSSWTTPPDLSAMMDFSLLNAIGASLPPPPASLPLSPFSLPLPPPPPAALGSADGTLRDVATVDHPMALTGCASEHTSTTA